ncbi:uncharacterized protein LOC117782322 [Drosophila innubila]|uniref:uncharacterized protein LOC117782322 n=1 Tax=Drosophila innubila TaxID=198719 RepID=UPI00148BBBE9|nr:uncharacterized protein LOC117782322 [Drosophila innubila]
MNLLVNGLILLLLLAIILPYTEAEGVSGIYSDPAHPGKCVINPNLILNVGETAEHPDMQCARIVCGEKSFAKIQKCELELPLRYCKLGEPKFPNADYPICCPRKHICGHTRELPQSETIVDLQI